MSRFPSFLEYLNDKGAVVDKPEVEAVPDYHGPDEKTPPNSKVPYKTPTTPKAAQKGEEGFADMGDEKLKYKPNTAIKYDIKKDVMKEYVEAKGKTVEKARVDAVADYVGPKSDAPKGGRPYSAKAVRPGNKALGDLGDAELKYEPDTNTEKKRNTEAFLSKTKGMSLAEFTRHMLEDCGCGQVEGDDLPYVTAYTTGKFQPHPPEVIRYITTLADKNQGILENLVSTIVSTGFLGKLLKAVFAYPQAYDEFTALLGDEENGPSMCKSFAGSMNNSYNKFLSDQEGLYESVSGPIGFDSDEDEDEDEHHHHHHNHHDEESEEGEEEGDDDHENDDEDLGDEGHGDDEDFGEEGHDDDKDWGMDDESHEDKDEDEGEKDEPKERKLKKKFAHHHLLDAMKGHEAMFKAMSERRLSESLNPELSSLKRQEQQLLMSMEMRKDPMGQILGINKAGYIDAVNKLKEVRARIKELERSGTEDSRNEVKPIPSWIQSRKNI